MQWLYDPWIALQPKHALVFVLFLFAFVLLQLQLYNAETEDRRIPRFSSIDASFESRHKLQSPITIVTAASANHACALEAFLYHLHATLSQLTTDPHLDLLQQEERIRIGREYVKTSRDLEAIRKRPKRNKKKQPTGDESTHDTISTPQEQQQQQQYGSNKHSPPVLLKHQTAEPLGTTFYETRPRVVVYNMGMGPTKRKRRLLKALAEAGYMDDILDFDFDPYPPFWRLDPETRGEYGWKAGIIEQQVSQRIQENHGDTTKDWHQDKGKQQEVAKWSGSEERRRVDDEGMMDSAAEEELINHTNTAPPTQQRPHQPNIVLWLDSGDRISLGFLRWLPSFLLHRGLWTPQSQDTLQTWTHPGLLQYYHDSLDRFAPDETNCNGAAIAFDVDNHTLRDGLLKEWIQCAKTQECIAPKGSNRNNHRQDQAALTYLVKTMGFGSDLCHGFPEDFGIQVNQDHFCKQDVAANPNRVVVVSS
ncbi:hypothetical protein BGZ67_002456 [Mortierella alpina]|nr:hypothetical protein BGZ67_002456 [Mortierella alpina]